MDFLTLTIGKQKNIALIAHDSKKHEMIEWCEANKEILKGHFQWHRNYRENDHRSHRSPGKGL